MYVRLYHAFATSTGGWTANPLANKAKVVTTYAKNKALTTAMATPVPSSPTGSDSDGGPGNPHALPDETYDNLPQNSGAPLHVKTMLDQRDGDADTLPLNAAGNGGVKSTNAPGGELYVYVGTLVPLKTDENARPSLDDKKPTSQTS